MISYAFHFKPLETVSTISVWLLFLCNIYLEVFIYEENFAKAMFYVK